jgi:hypothetical protein
VNNASISTLLDLLAEYTVEVPRVQRDYAQGRHDEHTNLVRANFLSDMKDAVLKQMLPLDLNFVYGKVENKKFIPIDGQQRLTTLFLLHLYAFCDDESKTAILHNFSYETRTSSRVFLEKLIDNRSVVFSSDVEPSMEIEDSEWFVSGWRFDPTIQSALVMLDDIKITFSDICDLGDRLSNQEYKPIVFKFLEMNDLGMEDSLYIKLNARGKSLTSFENFKARLVGRMQKLNIPFEEKFELNFDQAWTDLFWSHNKQDFDRAYLMFFGGILMGKGICRDDYNWSNSLAYDKLDTEVYETVYYSLNYLCANLKDADSRYLIFKALSEGRTFRDRVIFFAFTKYMHLTKGVDTGSLTQWLRVCKNLALNTQIDSELTYRRAIDGVSKIANKHQNIYQYLSGGGDVAGFNGEQIEEERVKASIILLDDEFAAEIYQAEQHPYFSGQIRSALYFADIADDKYDKEVFVEYWSKISALFENNGPRHSENLLRRALLTFRDYTLPAGNGNYKTLCVNDPDEAQRTPSMKRLFSDNRDMVEQLLGALPVSSDVGKQLESIVENSDVNKNDWRYCLIAFPALFDWMSASHLRLRNENGEMLIVPNKSSNGYSYEIFGAALYVCSKKKMPKAEFNDSIGTWADHYLLNNGLYYRFKNGSFSIKDKDDKLIFQTKTANPIEEIIRANII